jgi:Predicted integral membrane protein (DUF2269)
MDLKVLFPWVLFLHVLGAIIAFGPTFAFSIVGAMGGKEPQHANFATRVSQRIGDRLVEPLAIFQGITGVLLIWIGGRNLFGPESRWLLLAIVLYGFGLYFAIFVQSRWVSGIIEMTSAPPPPGASGPPPALAELIRKVQRGGMILGINIAVIVLLMVVKPTFF